MAVIHSTCFCGNKLTVLSDQSKNMKTITDVQLVKTADFDRGEYHYSLFCCNWCNSSVERITIRFNKRSEHNANS